MRTANIWSRWRDCCQPIIYSVVMGFVAIGLTACGGMNTQPSETPKGLQSLAAGFQFRPTTVDNRIRYRDACGDTQVIDLEPLLTNALTQEMKALFAFVETSSHGSSPAVVDRVIQAELSGNDLIVFVAGKGPQVYPATLTIGTTVSSSDAGGMVLDRTQIQSQVVGSVRTEGDHCRVLGVEALAQEVVSRLAEDFTAHLQSSTSLLSGQPSSLGAFSASNDHRGRRGKEEGPSTNDTIAGTSNTEGTLVFKALVMDHNHNDILEGGESMVVEVEVTNNSAILLQAVQVVVTGSSSLTRLMTDTIQIGTIQPRETKRVKVRGRVGAVSTMSEGELLLSLTVGTPGVLQPPAKRYVVTVGPSQS